MHERALGDFVAPAIGLGCMNLSHAYGIPPQPEQARVLLRRALDIGITHFDSAALYGFGRNEELVGPFLKSCRDRVVLTSKCGLRGEGGVRTLDASPKKLREDIELSLLRLQTDVIDVYYLHRYDKVTPIEESVGELSRLVEQGKVRHLGLSEVSEGTLRRAHATHPIAAVQSEYSLWSRNVELGVLDACCELGVAFVAFSPLGRGFLTDVDLDPRSFVEEDIRRGMPRFQSPHFSMNVRRLAKFRTLAAESGCSATQLALSWVLSRGNYVHAIPGTTSVDHLQENYSALDLELDASTLKKLDAMFRPDAEFGPRYPAKTQAEIDTEEFDM